MTSDTEALVCRAYHLAEGDVLDVQGFNCHIGITTMFAQLGVLPTSPPQ
jgi:hypothetical protein